MGLKNQGYLIMRRKKTSLIHNLLYKKEGKVEPIFFSGRSLDNIVPENNNNAHCPASLEHLLLYLHCLNFTSKTLIGHNGYHHPILHG